MTLSTRGSPRASLCSSRAARGSRRTAGSKKRLRLPARETRIRGAVSRAESQALPGPRRTYTTPRRTRRSSRRFLSRIRGGEGAHMAAAAPGTPGTPSHRLLDCQVESPGRWSVIAGTALAALLPPSAGRGAPPRFRIGSEDAWLNRRSPWFHLRASHCRSSWCCCRAGDRTRSGHRCSGR